MLVEMSCGSVLASIYQDVIPKLQKEGKLKEDIKVAALLVCGGTGIKLQSLLDYKTEFGL